MRAGRVVRVLAPHRPLPPAAAATPRVVGLRPAGSRCDLTRTPPPLYLLSSQPSPALLHSSASAPPLSSRPLARKVRG